jgi:hypothetical protein
MKKSRQITLILTDFTERIGGNFIHLSSEQIILFNLFKISSISEISGSNLPFQDHRQISSNKHDPSAPEHPARAYRASTGPCASPAWALHLWRKAHGPRRHASSSNARIRVPASR